MKFNMDLIPGKLIRRYKRFLSDIELEDGSIVVAHCTNSGSMKTCIEEGAPVYLSPAKDPKRKTKFTWEMIFIHNHWIGINTSIPNLLVYEAIRDQKIAGINKYTEVKREVQFGNSRFDVYAENDQEKCFIEVKNVTMKVGNKALFPDAVTTRGQKHLKTLMEVKKEGMRAIMFYVIQRQDIHSFGAASEIDPHYAMALKEAYEMGVEIFPYIAQVSPKGIELTQKLPFTI
ncbi:DNA/RNA nuclease SfsA [Saccharicrinis fermentans]|uniref:Sugar fermentation stimulation protein homolog n=1 Tax=Saccharicrinis fermentans DSM 9555 = JCM 21142 TaxID=869213 RepID=W7YA19_9BACT|nr:DNA/RNA nuclease SfsA [Saccharicrinis fermentans]GAF04403.1 sugar fermentation stimulation protein A [Saccharicrinis fermentans DSM 9555 = JCM 21142]